MTTDRSDRRALVDLLPQFLTRVTRGWNGLSPLLDELGLDRPAFFLLRALAQERDGIAPMTRDAMQRELFNPYSTIRPILDALPALAEMGLIGQQAAGYFVTTAGREVVARGEAARDAYLSSLAPIGVEDLAALVEALYLVARHLRDAEEPRVKAHQARAWRTMSPAHAALMVRLYGAVYTLWMARDDSHNAAWRAAGFDGPSFDLLSHAWSGAAETAAELTEAVRQFQRPEDVRQGIAALEAAGYLTRDGDVLRVTASGRETRDRIETETDRIFFRGWPDHAGGAWARHRKTLETIVANLPA